MLGGGWWWVVWGWRSVGLQFARARVAPVRVPAPIGFINTRCRSSWADIQLSTVAAIRSDQLTVRARAKSK